MEIAAALADPVRVRLVEMLASGEHAAGELAASAARAFGISQPATSRHLRVLREAGLVVARADGTRRIYSLADDALDGLDEWVARLRTLWAGPMLALETEIARGQHDRRSEAALRPGRSTRDEGATP